MEMYLNTLTARQVHDQESVVLLPPGVSHDRIAAFYKACIDFNSAK